MRKLIVKNFVLLAEFKLFGKTISYLRAARIMMPSFIIGFILLNNIDNAFIKALIFIYFLLLIWIGFDWMGVGYFKLFPVKWNELDILQKYHWGKIDPKKLSAIEYKEWLLIKEIYEKKNK